MNIFDKFLDKTKPLILINQKKLGIEKINEFKGITVESPPSEFNFDLSLNISMVLAKLTSRTLKN